MATAAPLLLDHVINPNHDALGHSAVFSGPEGNLFCVHCASERLSRRCLFAYSPVFSLRPSRQSSRQIREPFGKPESVLAIQKHQSIRLCCGRGEAGLGRGPESKPPSAQSPLRHVSPRPQFGLPSKHSGPLTPCARWFLNRLQVQERPRLSQAGATGWHQHHS